MEKISRSKSSSLFANGDNLHTNTWLVVYSEEDSSKWQSLKINK